MISSSTTANPSGPISLGAAIRALRSKVTPVMMKKTGTRKPKPGFQLRLDHLAVGGRRTGNSIG